MIKRIFTVTIDPSTRDDFEKGFNSISIQAIENCEGFISTEIGKPTKWHPNTYAMISNWESEESLVKFAGENWNQAVIPKEMEQYVVSCAVEHFYIS